MRAVRATALIVGMLLAAGALGLAQRARIDATALVDDLRQLSADAMEGRRVGTAGGARARALLVDRFRAAGLRPFAGTFEQPFRGATGVAGVNVVGYVPGRVRPDRYLVIGAHYDHLGIRDGRVFNGANDNASGAAALAVLAAYFVQHRPATSLVFAAFDGEEAGLVGSRAFVARPPVPRAAILIALNMDMIGRDPANTLWVVGTHQQPALVPLVDQAAARASVVLRRGYDNPADGRSRDWTRDSDHWAFLEAGLPALYFGVEDFALHHDPDDDFDRMTLDFYVRAVESMVDVVEVMDAGAGTLERLTPARPRAR